MLARLRKLNPKVSNVVFDVASLIFNGVMIFTTKKRLVDFGETISDYQIRLRDNTAEWLSGGMISDLVKLGFHVICYATLAGASAATAGLASLAAPACSFGADVAVSVVGYRISQSNWHKDVQMKAKRILSALTLPGLFRAQVEGSMNEENTPKNCYHKFGWGSTLGLPVCEGDKIAQYKPLECTAEIEKKTKYGKHGRTTDQRQITIWRFM